MVARGTMRIPCALTALIVLVIGTTFAGAWESQYRYPIKVRVSGMDGAHSTVGPTRMSSNGPEDWGVAAGASRSEILCPRRGFSFGIGMRPFFSNLSGSTKVVSKGGEGTYLNLGGHLRIPTENTLWEFYSVLRLWDKVSVNLEYVPWYWSGPGHAGTDGNFAGLLLHLNDPIHSDLEVTRFVLGADYDVAFGRDVVFGPNADMNVIKWRQRVGKDMGEAADFTQTIIQPSIGAHIRYEPSSTGYFSWFKPYLEGRFTWMSFYGLGLATWDMGAGAAPPVSRNVDAGVKLGYKQWKLDGNRGRLFADVTVEGPYLDFALRF
ncbi:MAG: hypothetical protein AB1733_10380 [Thermodesulfobacteriota bacterium]